MSSRKYAGRRHKCSTYDFMIFLYDSPCISSVTTFCTEGVDDTFSVSCYALKTLQYHAELIVSEALEALDLEGNIPPR